MSQQPATQSSNKKTIKALLESENFMGQMAKVLPKHLTPNRMLRVAFTAMMRTPKLWDCTGESLCSCLLSLSQIGLEPDGRLAHLIPYGTTCTVIIDWKGLAQLAYRSGMVSGLHADVIYTGDIFEYNCGLVEKHIPYFLRIDQAKPQDRGTLVGAYSIGVMKDGVKMAVVLSADEIDAIRKRSRASNNGPWVTDTNEMRKKTAFRRLSKWLPLESEKYREALDADDDGGDSITKVTPEPVNVDALLTQRSTRELPAPTGEDDFTAQVEREPELVPARRANGAKPAARSVAPAPAEPARDICAVLQDILDAQNCPLSDFVECIVGDNQLLGAAPEDIKTVQDIRKAAVEFYIAEDGAQARQSIAWAREQKKEGVTP